MTILKMLADAFHDGDWMMWPILVVMMLIIALNRNAN